MKKYLVKSKLTPKSDTKLPNNKVSQLGLQNQIWPTDSKSDNEIELRLTADSDSEMKLDS